MVGDDPNPPSGWKIRLTLALPIALGLALRIGAARGDYWLDEAWTALFAREARTPGEMLLAIGHGHGDLLTIAWLQLVGWGGSPLLGRALSIACGAAGIGVAGLIGLRRGPGAALLTATMTAISPILVTYGSEASGHAVMLLALLVSIWIVDRALFGRPPRHAAAWLSLAGLLGTLADMSMLYGVAALSGWVLIERGRHMPAGRALAATLWLMGGPVAAVVAALLLILLGTYAGADGLLIGGHAAFSWPAFLDALVHMLAFTIGWTPLIGLPMLALLLLPLTVRRKGALADRAPFFLIAILGLPLLVALLRPEGSALPRYYLLVSMALLLLIADLLAALIARQKQPAAVAAGMILVAGLVADTAIVGSRRGDPGKAVDAMISRAPGGAAVMLDHGGDSAVLESAAASRVYQLLAVESCAPARFVYLSSDGTRSLPLAALRCGAAFRPVAAGHAAGLSGMDWQLYERVR
ncbi:hypothetical protein ACFOHO_00715 [Rhizorhabdus histidinilytica]|uniref:Glycosyltransferase RgtA/B/C/D-like domain-containing protein n=1 Tax=Rhizorhabdus histidinilytica TaxID=439228 RepID=A0A1T5G6Z8_9SPHN|nr:hypothetical protein [Rhizorhabdus histidinilytica]SKC04127.1 hypothetical protein SAMN06295920_11273 [Rhizorhabdus histidinilytica]